MNSTIDTLNYFIAGYIVIFGSIIGYIVSLFIRWKNLKQEEEILTETTDQK